MTSVTINVQSETESTFDFCKRPGTREQVEPGEEVIQQWKEMKKGEITKKKYVPLAREGRIFK